MGALGTLKAALGRASYGSFLGALVVFFVTNDIRLHTDPEEVHFYLDDRRYGKKHLPETVPYNAVMAFHLVAVAAVFGVEALGRRAHRSWLLVAQSTVQGTLLLLAGFCFQFGVVEATKIAVGELRPDFLERCQPDADAFEEGAFRPWPCLGRDEHLISAGRRSFPSGHTSTAYYLAAFVSAFLLSAAYRRDWRHWGAARASAPFLGAARWLREAVDAAVVMAVFMSFAPAAYVGNSRILDNRHHPHDVVGGALIGIFCGFVAVAVLEGHNRAAAEAALKRAADFGSSEAGDLDADGARSPAGTGSDADAPAAVVDVELSGGRR